MKPESTKVSVEIAGGKQLSIETGKLAKQAHGAAVVRFGENVVLATATSNPEPRLGIDFFPLTVDYREYTYAGGRFPGGFIKREGRMSERIGQLTDHFKTHLKDHGSRRGLLMMVSRRRGLLDYLKKYDSERYKTVISKLGIRK